MGGKRTFALSLSEAEILGYTPSMDHTEEGWAPARWRVLLAFALVPGLAAVGLAAAQPAYEGLDSFAERVWRTALIFSIFGYPLGWAVGIPTYVFLRHRVRPTWLNCSLASAFVAALPWAILVFLGPSADQASVGGTPTVVNGNRTLYGLLFDLQMIGIIALCGALAGLLFWAIAAARLDVR
jgi:lysylphosphatidylglycerol synthetase-like protein (DUF2156 family)